MMFSVVLCGLLMLAGASNGSEKPDNDFLHFTRFQGYGAPGQLVKKEAIDRYSINVLRRAMFIITDVMGSDEENYKPMVDNYLKDNLMSIFLVERNHNTEVNLQLTNDAYAQAVADYILELYKKTKEVYLILHLVGYKSGAHVAAKAARIVAKETGRKVLRITALSPTHDSENDILIKDDAEFVDVTHTNTKNVDYTKPLGHVDFYPNGGQKQPGCDDKDEFKVDACSQRKALEYFSLSALSDKLKAVKCSSWKDFEEGQCVGKQETAYGEHVDKEARGTFFMKID